MLNFDKASRRIRRLRSLMNLCRLCPRNCRVDRWAGERGFCGAGPEAAVTSAGPHFGEEPCLVGRGGSGTIFLAGCNLRCVFCQNFDISHRLVGETMDASDLARLMLALEARGCENINFVTPTHVAAPLAEAIVEARQRGLGVPIVWNSSGYESVEVMRLLEGLVEIYMPDFKFGCSESAERYCRAPDYPERAREALREMHRQVGDLVIEGGVARRGLLVRHLVMPSGLEESREILSFLASLSPRTFVNVMGQYRPEGVPATAEGRAEYSEIARRPTGKEIAGARAEAQRLGLRLAQ
jgi:putative pyruvate formate lyase activating enzyme